MSATSIIDTLFHGRLRAASNHLLWMGLGMTALGIVSLIFPMLSTLAVAIFVGWMLLISGVIIVTGAFSLHGTGPFFGALLLGLLSIAGGIFLVFNPLAGAIALTLMVGLIFMLQGSFELYFALEVRPHSGWVAMLVSAAASILLSLLIVAGWPAVSLVALGVLIGVNFVSTGLGYISVSRASKPSA